MLLALVSFHVFISDIWSNFRNWQEFCSISFLDSHYFIDCSSDIDTNFPCLCRRLPTRFTSLPAERRLRSAAAATRKLSFGCECESAAMQPFRHRCTRATAGWLATLLSPPRAWRCVAPPSAWSRLNGWRVAHNSKSSGRCNNRIPANWHPPWRAVAVLSAAGCLQPADRSSWAWGLLCSMLHSSVTSHIPAVTSHII